MGYLMLNEFLATPAMVNLCTRLQSTPGTRQSNSSGANSSSPVSGQSLVLMLFRTPAIASALRAMGQAVLCLTEPSLVRALRAVGERHGTSGVRGEVYIGLDGALATEVVASVSLAWAALLECRSANDMTFQPMLTAISRQLHACPEWAWHKLPRIDDPIEALHALWETVQHRLPQSSGRAPIALSESSNATGQDVDGVLTTVGRQQLASQGWRCQASEAKFVGSEWQKPKQSGEAEILLHLTFMLATLIDRLLDRGSLDVGADMFIPQTEWPRTFANWKLTGLLCAILFWRGFWI